MNKTQKQKKKSARGGARKGAGRKPLGRIKTLVSFAPETHAELKRRADEQNSTLGEIIDGLVIPEGRSK